jgi:hypothetical protein
MSQITICDVCRERNGLTQRLSVAGPVYPHKGERIVESEGIDICTDCLRWVGEISTPKALDELQRAFRHRVEEDCDDFEEGGAA